jgi:NAD(P)-dependent dehydrogenase (short-subunit alcohol dehydrogenase family)
MTASARLAGRVALVTGGASGIGRKIAERIAREGADVSILDKNGGFAEAVASTVRQSGRKSVAIAVEITDATAVGKAVGEAIAVLGPLSVLVNNAGGAVGQTFDDTDPVTWRGDIELNLSGAFYVTRAALPAMLERGGGAIVNVATVNALGSISEPAYSAAKAGLLQLTRQLAVEYGPRGIRTNAVIPGSIRTPIWDHHLATAPQILDVLRRWYPVGRVGEPEDVAAAVLFLASAEAGFIDGAELLVDGGLTAGLPQMAKDIMMARTGGSAD